MRSGLALIAALLLTGCAGGEDAAESEDPSVLSEELEARASAIEKRADEAVLAVEKEAADELAALAAETEQAEADQAEADASDEAAAP